MFCRGLIVRLPACPSAHLACCPPACPRACWRLPQPAAHPPSSAGALLTVLAAFPAGHPSELQEEDGSTAVVSSWRSLPQPVTAAEWTHEAQLLGQVGATPRTA